MRLTKKHVVGAASIVAIAAVAMIGGATGMGRSDSPSIPKKSAKKPTGTAKDPAPAEVHKLMKQAAQKDDSAPDSASRSEKKLSAKGTACSNTPPELRACAVYSRGRSTAEARTNRPVSKLAIAIQKSGQPISYPRICVGRPNVGVTTCSFNFNREPRQHYKFIAAYWDGSRWTYPAQTGWVTT